MPNLLNAEALSKSHGEQPLLRNVSLGVDAGDRIGVVGLNGGGKTTLLELLAGLEPPDSGRVARSRDLRTAVVTQRSELPQGATVRQLVIDPLATGSDFEWASDPRVRSVLRGLGLDRLGSEDDRQPAEWLDAVVDTLSGGERRRVALAAALVHDLDLVVLDEPTNHLDVEGVQWLAEHLLARKCALLIVTHDRWFLDTVCTRTWEVVDGGVQQYEGGYADWIYARAERARLARATEDKRRNLARKELAWLRRGPQARTSKPKFRIEEAESIINDVPPPRDTVELMAFARRRLGNTVLELEDATLRAGDRDLLQRVTWRLGPGQRIGVVGVNGSGKTSLLRLLAGRVEPEAGRRVEGKTVRIAYLSQELEELPGQLRVREAISEVAGWVSLGRQELSASQLATRFGFPAGRQWTPVSELSGGERRRLQLARLLMAEPNVLLLDEPTNDLDIETLQQLEDLLDGWPGTMVVVSHDRYLVQRVCDETVAMFGDGSISDLPGGIEQYLRARAEAADAGGIAALRTAGGLTSSEPAASAEADFRSGSGRRSGAQMRAARKELARVERQLEKTEQREQQLHEELAEAATQPERLQELEARRREVVQQRDELEAQWLAAAEEAG